MKKQPAFGSIDLKNGVLPITKAIPILAELVKRARLTHSHIVITQGGYPAVVLMGIDDYTEMHDLAMQALDFNESPNQSD